MRVLLVDDSLAFLVGCRELLERAGFAVTSCLSFDEARRALDLTHVDAVVTDVRLGPYNGLQLLHRARSIDRSLRLIATTAFDDPVIQSEAREVGATYLVKSPTCAELIEALGPGPLETSPD